MTKQKTWADLLGINTDNVIVDGRYLVRQIGQSNCCLRLWGFDTHAQEVEALMAWRAECLV